MIPPPFSDHFIFLVLINCTFRLPAACYLLCIFIYLHTDLPPDQISRLCRTLVTLSFVLMYGSITFCYIVMNAQMSNYNQSIKKIPLVFLLIYIFASLTRNPLFSLSLSLSLHDSLSFPYAHAFARSFPSCACAHTVFNVSHLSFPCSLRVCFSVSVAISL